jgi:germacradienol/geosmin synthase
MGMLDDHAVWDERRYDTADYPLLCAYTHPDAPGDELDLITEWYVWLFYFDDSFLESYKRTGDVGGAKRYVGRLRALMAIEPADGAAVAPRDPVERGLADLWPRTIVTMSDSWRRRYAADTRDALEESLCELSNISRGRVPGPIEYIEMRRMVGGALWASDLIEHAADAEVPARIAAARPMQVLRDTVSDGVHLRNDIFSYERETQVEGELNNGVLVVERFLGCDPQRAADVVNDLITSRMQQFENTVVTELPLLLAEHRLGPDEQARVLRYVKGLQDWQSGAHEWHLRSSRYTSSGSASARQPGLVLRGPTGLGTSATQVKLSPGTLGLRRLASYTHAPYAVVGPVRVPEIHLPFAHRCSPHAGSARRATMTWAERMGLLADLPGMPGVGIWDEQTLVSFELASCAAMIHPEGSAAEVELVACWLTWNVYADDYFAVVYGARRDLAGARAFTLRLAPFMPVSAGPTPPAANPAEKSLADLWARTAPSMSVPVRRWFRRSLLDMIGSWSWEVANQLQNRVPDPIDYIEMNRRTAGCDLLMTLSPSAWGPVLPARPAASRPLRALGGCTADVIGLANDLYSLQKEIQFEGDLNNGVLVVQRFLACDLARAVDIVHRLVQTRVRQFEHIVAAELPVLAAEAPLDASERAALAAHVARLQDLLAGVLEWLATSGRYRELELRRRYGIARLAPEAPAALGRSSARESALHSTLASRL